MPITFDYLCLNCGRIEKDVWFRRAKDVEKFIKCLSCYGRMRKLVGATNIDKTSAGSWRREQDE